MTRTRRLLVALGLIVAAAVGLAACADLNGNVAMQVSRGAAPCANCANLTVYLEAKSGTNEIHEWIPFTFTTDGQGKKELSSFPNETLWNATNLTFDWWLAENGDFDAKVKATSEPAVEHTGGSGDPHHGDPVDHYQFSGTASFVLP